MMQDADGTVPFFWGTDADGHLVLTDDEETVKKGCGKSSAPFPKGKSTSLVSIHIHSLICGRKNSKETSFGRIFELDIGTSVECHV